MVWLRRSLAGLLGLVFLLLFLLTLLLFRVHDTLLKPSFYTGVLQEARFFDSLYDDVFPAMLDQALAEGLPEGFDPGEVKQEALRLSRTVLPPEWLQARTDDLLGALLPYFTGATDSFSVTIPLAGRAEALRNALREELTGGRLFEVAYDGMVRQLVRDALSEPEGLPLGLKATPDDLEGAVRTVLPPQWLRQRALQALDSVYPYLTGASPGFSLTIPLRDRVEAAGEAVKTVLGRDDNYAILFNTLVVPQLKAAVGGPVEVGYGVTISPAEVVEAVAGSIPPERLRAWGDGVVDQTVAYMTGRSPRLDLVIPIGEAREQISSALVDLADSRLEQAVMSLPECPLPSFLLQTAQGELPSCRPEGLAYREVKRLLGIDNALLAKLLSPLVPPVVLVPQEGIRKAMGEEGWGDLQRAREWFTRGASFTEGDLLARMPPQGRESLERMRRTLREGYTFTQEDLRRWLAQGPEGEASLARVDLLRSALGAFRRWRWALPGVLALLLAGIALLGGRELVGRSAWASAVLGVSALLLLLIAYPGYTSLVAPRMEAGLEQALAGAEPAARPAVELGFRVARLALEGFLGGLRLQALIALLLSLALIAGALAWHRLRSTK